MVHAVDPGRGDADFVLRYRLAGDEIEGYEHILTVALAAACASRTMTSVGSLVVMARCTAWSPCRGGTT